jgi:muconolactone D-isomerase
VEFLVQIQVNLPVGVDPTDLVQREQARGRELKAAGTIVRIWRVPGRTASVGIWQAEDATALHEAIASMPMFPYLDATVTPLATHYLEADDGR